MQALDQRHRPRHVRSPGQAHGDGVGHTDLRAPGAGAQRREGQPHFLEPRPRRPRLRGLGGLVNPVMELSGPQTVALGKLSQAQPALPLLLPPSRTLAAALPQLSLPIVFHPTTIASRAHRRLEAPCLPLTFNLDLWLLPQKVRHRHVGGTRQHTRCNRSRTRPALGPPPCACLSLSKRIADLVGPSSCSSPRFWRHLVILHSRLY